MDASDSVFLVVFLVVFFGVIIAAFVAFFRSDHIRYQKQQAADSRKLAEYRSLAGPYADAPIPPDIEAAMSREQHQDILEYRVMKAVMKNNEAQAVDLFGPDKPRTKCKKFAPMLLKATGLLLVVAFIDSIHWSVLVSLYLGGILVFNRIHGKLLLRKMRQNRSQKTPL